MGWVCLGVIILPVWFGVWLLETLGGGWFGWLVLCWVWFSYCGIRLLPSGLCVSGGLFYVEFVWGGYACCYELPLVFSLRGVV